MSSPHRFDALADALDRDGFADQPLAVRRLLDAVVAEARRSQVSSVLVDVLADPAQPDVARQRAFGRVASALQAPARQPSVCSAA